MLNQWIQYDAYMLFLYDMCFKGFYRLLNDLRLIRFNSQISQHVIASHKVTQLTQHIQNFKRFDS